MYIYTYNRTLCAQVHELPQSHCGDNREGTLFIYIVYNIQKHNNIHEKLMFTQIQQERQ